MNQEERRHKRFLEALSYIAFKAGVDTFERRELVKDYIKKMV